MKKLNYLRSFEFWIYGLACSVIAGAANTLVLMVVDPKTFNLQGLSPLKEVAIVSGLFAAATYLIKSPLPPLPKEDDADPPPTP